MRAGIAALLCSLTLGSGPRPVPAPPPFPWQRVSLERSQVADLERGLPVVKVLDTRNERDVALFGVIRSDVLRARHVAWLADPRRSLATPTRLRFDLFHDPAVASDVNAVELDRADVDDARNCRPGHCVFKVPATEMQKIRTQVDWSPGADAAGQLNRYLHQRLVEYADDYRAHGDSAMLVYDDVGHVHASDAFGALLDQVRDIYGDIPSLQQYLARWSRTAPDSVHQLLFWAQDSMPGLKSILSLTHEVIYQPPEFSGVTLVAAKEIYAGHFFEGALDLTAVVDRPAGAAPEGSYLVVLRLSRFDDLPNGPIVSVRSKVISKLRDQLRLDLTRLRGAVP